MSSEFIPVCEPTIGNREREYLLEAFDSGWISSNGPFNEMLENKFSDYCDCKYGISVSNGTTALHLAIKALNLKEGDEVIVPNFNGIYALYALLYERITPIFVDSNKSTWNIDPLKIEEKITSKTKAILLVHIYGHPCEMEKIIDLSKKYNLKIIEDSAEAIGAEYKQRKIGSFGDVSTFSFFANKTITSGEGGMILTNNEAIYDSCRYFRNQCFPLNGPRNFVHSDIGHNYRLTNLQAALVCAQLEKIDELIDMRIKINQRYQSNLHDVECITFQPQADWAKNVFWMSCILLHENENNLTREDLETHLLKNNIQTRRLFVGLNNQPIVKKLSLRTNEEFTCSDYLENKGIYLPSTSHLSNDKIDFICEVIRNFINKK